jgi:ribosomal-protein-alanine N-acetyltransferase
VEDQRGLGGAVKIRFAAPPDLPTIATLEARSFSNPWNPDTFRSLLEREGVRIFVAEDSNEGVVGYSVIWWVLDQGELANLAVRPEFRKRGIGAALLDHSLHWAGSQGVESLFLEVRVSNESANRLYGSRGFTQISTRRDYYQNPREDARILMKRLNGAPSEAVEKAEGS